MPILRVRDGRAAAAWYERLGFRVTGEHRFEPELPLYLFLQRGEMRLHLSEHRGDAPPGSVVYMYVADVDAIAEVTGATVVDQPWCREVVLTDPDGNRLRVGTPHRQ